MQTLYVLAVASLTSVPLPYGVGFLQAVLINQGWECKGARGKARAARLAKVPMAQLCPSGFIFIWVDKMLVGQLLRRL